MKIEVRLFANLRELLPKENRGVTELDVPEGSTTEDVAKMLKIPEDIHLIVMVNGRREIEIAPLQAGDRVGIFPPVGGG